MVEVKPSRDGVAKLGKAAYLNYATASSNLAPVSTLCPDAFEPHRLFDYGSVAELV